MQVLETALGLLSWRDMEPPNLYPFLPAWGPCSPAGPQALHHFPEPDTGHGCVVGFQAERCHPPGRPSAQGPRSQLASRPGIQMFPWVAGGQPPMSCPRPAVLGEEREEEVWRLPISGTSLSQLMLLTCSTDGGLALVQLSK